MPAASSLKDLIRIRHQNRAYIDSINENLGSALGFKRRTGEEASEDPAILIFVPRKINPKWLGDQVIKKELSGPGGLSCLVDVVEGTTVIAAAVFEVPAFDTPFGIRHLNLPPYY